jgi:2-polyprenyl-6-methoxyphenol hydroxylase-like FAD-dependent oxidoreductase
MSHIGIIGSGIAGLHLGPGLQQMGIEAIADSYADGYNHPDRFWAIASSAERTAAFLRDMAGKGSSSAIQT